jgi:hypothetical protein
MDGIDDASSAVPDPGRLFLVLCVGLSPSATRAHHAPISTMYPGAPQIEAQIARLRRCGATTSSSVLNAGASRSALLT